MFEIGPEFLISVQTGYFSGFPEPCPLTEGPMWNLVKTGQAVSEKMKFKDYAILYMYTAQGKADNPEEQNSDFNLKSLLLWSYIVNFSR